jgi:hypothetical protein
MDTEFTKVVSAQKGTGFFGLPAKYSVGKQANLNKPCGDETTMKVQFSV